MVTYRYEDSQLKVLPFFLYEVSVYRISQNRISSLSCTLYKSDKFLNTKERETVKRFKNFSIDRFITLLGAPMSFIEENNLPIFEFKKPKKKTKNERKKN